MTAGVHRLLVGLLVLLLCAGCRVESVDPGSTPNPAGASSLVDGFRVFPGAVLLENQTEAFHKAHFILNPDTKSVPQMAIYESDASLEEVAEFYANECGYPRVARNAVNDFSVVPPSAYYTTGDLRSDAESLRSLLQEMNLNVDLSGVAGEYRGAQIKATREHPRVTIQRPWVDMMNGEVVKSTVILVVKD